MSVKDIQEDNPLKIEFEPFYWKTYQSCLSKAFFGGMGIMMATCSGMHLTHQLVVEKLPRPLQKWRLFPVFVIAGGLTYLFERHQTQKCRDEFFLLERKRAGADVPTEWEKEQ